MMARQIQIKTIVITKVIKGIRKTVEQSKMNHEVKMIIQEARREKKG